MALVTLLTGDSLITSGSHPIFSEVHLASIPGGAQPTIPATLVQSVLVYSHFPGKHSTSPRAGVLARHYDLTGNNSAFTIER